MAIILALSVARPHTTPGPVMRDFEAYYAAGQAWTARDDPYSVQIWPFERRVPGVNGARPELLPFVGPPAYLPLWALLSRLQYGTAALLWGAILIASSAMLLVLVLRRADSMSMGTFVAAACVLVGFGPWTSDLALGQAALVSFVACAAVTVMLHRSRAGAIVSTFIAALQPNIALVLLSQASGRRAWQIFGTAFAVFLILGMLCTGWRGAGAYFADLSAHGDAERFALIQMTPAAIAYGFGLPPFADRIIGTVMSLSAFAVWLGAVRRPLMRALWKLAISCALLPFVAPFFHEHDFVVLLLPALYCASAAGNRIWTIAAAGTVLGAVDWLGLAQRPDGLMQTLLLTIALLSGIFALTEIGWRHMLVPCAVLLLVLGAGLAAHGHPAPVWPDAMRAGRLHSASVAQIWSDELSRTGQFAVQPLWAALRLLTLTGAALLSWASIATATKRDQLEMS